METERIKTAYTARELSWPAAEHAFLFFLSEVGELSEAYLAAGSPDFYSEVSTLLQEFPRLGSQADALVSRVPGWVRNNDRQRNANIPHEIADCQMMLPMFSERLLGINPDQALREKMVEKLAGLGIALAKKPESK